MNQNINVIMNENEPELQNTFLIDRKLTLDEVKEARRIIDETEVSLEAFRQIKLEDIQALNDDIALQTYQNTVELGRLDSVEETIGKVNTKIVETLDSSGELTQEHIIFLINYIEKNFDKMMN